MFATTLPHLFNLGLFCTYAPLVFHSVMAPIHHHIGLELTISATRGNRSTTAPNHFKCHLGTSMSIWWSYIWLQFGSNFAPIHRMVLPFNDGWLSTGVVHFARHSLFKFQCKTGLSSVGTPQELAFIKKEHLGIIFYDFHFATFWVFLFSRIVPRTSQQLWEN